MSILAFIILGLVAGLLARALMPGRQSMGIITTALLGMGGSLLGGALGAMFTHERVFELHAAGLIGSVVGSMIVLWIAVATSRRRTLI